MSRQILQASSNLLEYMQKEKDHEGLFESCGIYQNSRSDAIISIQDDIADLQAPPNVEVTTDLIAEVRNIFNETYGQSTTKEGEMQRNALCAELLLDLKEELSTSTEELDGIYSNVSLETREHKRNLMLLLADNHHSGDRHNIPKSLSNAFESLRVVLRKSHVIEDDSEIAFLESDLRRGLEDARREYDCILGQIACQNKIKYHCWNEKIHSIFREAFSLNNDDPRPNRRLLELLKKEMHGKSEQEIMQNYTKYLDFRKTTKANKQKANAASCEFKKKCQEIENDGLKEIESLRAELDSRSKSMKANIGNDLKRKEMHLRLQAMRLERGDAKNTKVENRLKTISKNYEKEAHRTQRMLETKRTLMKLKAEQIKENEEVHATNLQDDFAVEITNLKHQHKNRERTNYRQERTKLRKMDKERAEDEAFTAEENRLERLNALAASTPYYKSIMDKSSDIHKSTEARKNDVYGGRGNLADFQSGKLKSFTNDKLFSDAKFRLGNALHEAGVAHSTYARDVVRNSIPRVEARTTGIKPY